MTIEPIIINKSKRPNSEQSKNYVQIKPRVDKEIWKLFKAAVQIHGYDLAGTLTDALKLWLEYFFVNKCESCGKKIYKCRIIIGNDGKYMHYCSLKCFNERYND
jgi:hypothetical protein